MAELKIKYLTGFVSYEFYILFILNLLRLNLCQVIKINDLIITDRPISYEDRGNCISLHLIKILKCQQF